MGKTMRLPSPSMMVALLALLVALSGTAVAAGVVPPLARRALLADNAARLQGKTATQVVVQATRLPSPASTAAGLVSVKQVPWTIGPGGQATVLATCPPGQRAIAAGWDDPGGWAHEWDSKPLGDGPTWSMIITVSDSAPGGQSGSVQLICLR